MKSAVIIFFTLVAIFPANPANASTASDVAYSSAIGCGAGAAAALAGSIYAKDLINQSIAPYIIGGCAAGAAAGDAILLVHDEWNRDQAPDQTEVEAPDSQ